MGEALSVAIFWIALGLLCYVHFGYPLILIALRRFIPKAVKRSEVCPTVEFLIGAYNEEAVIRQKLENCLALDYPRDRLRIIVASDASTDGTDAIVREFEDRGVQLIASPRRRGKAANFREIVPGLKGEIVLFSDAGSLYGADTMKKIMRNFADPEVGCVGGRIRYRNPDATSVSQGEGLYWNYEVFLRKTESAIGSSMVLSGAVYAIRRELYRPVPDDLPDDFLCPLHVLDQGKRVLYETDTVIWETMATSARGELLTKVRIITRNFAALLTMKHLLNPFRSPLVSLQLLSHRLLRWFVLPLAALMLLASVLLAHRPFYLLALVGQLLFYGLAGVGWLMDLGGKRSRVAFLPYYFVLVNLAAAWGTWNCLSNRGRGAGVWEPVER